MHIRATVRAMLLGVVCVAVLGFLGACAAPTPPTPTGPVEGLVTEAGLFGVAGVVVRAQGRTTITDGDGRFTLEGIALPYDLSLSQTSGDGWLHVVEGLTDRAPVLDPFGSTVLAGPAPIADVSGALSGGGAWPLPAGREVVVCVEGLDALVIGCDTVSAGGVGYALSANLLFASEADVRLHALRIVQDVDGRPTGYEGYGVANVTLQAGVPSVVPLDLGVVPAVGDLNAAFDVPGGSSLDFVLVTMRLGGGSLLLYQGAVAGSTLTMPVPTLAGARYAVFAGAAAGGGNSTSWAVDQGLDVGTLGFAVPPQLVQPAGGATDVTAETVFEAVVPGSGPRTFRWTTGVGPDFALTTTRSSVALPDPVAVGLAWPSGASYTWTVRTHDAATVDAAAATLDTTGLSLAIFAGLDLPATGSVTESDLRALTFAP